MLNLSAHFAFAIFSSSSSVPLLVPEYSERQAPFFAKLAALSAFHSLFGWSAESSLARRAHLRGARAANPEAGGLYVTFVTASAVSRPSFTAWCLFLVIARSSVQPWRAPSANIWRECFPFHLWNKRLLRSS